MRKCVQLLLTTKSVVKLGNLEPVADLLNVQAYLNNHLLYATEQPPVCQMVSKCVKGLNVLKIFLHPISVTPFQYTFTQRLKHRLFIPSIRTNRGAVVWNDFDSSLHEMFPIYFLLCI